MLQDDLLTLCDGNKEAVDLINGFWGFAEVYDDLIDGEKNEADAAIHASMHWALFGLSENNFYRQHRELRSAMQVCIAEWKAANALEKSGDREKVATAFTLRCSPFSFFTAVVLAAAGPAAAEQAAIIFRSIGASDRLDDYMREHLKESHHGLESKTA
jgi:hypothetical protein